MTTARIDPMRAITLGDPEDGVQGHAYAWYDPDAADFDAPDPLADLEPLADEEVTAAVDRG